MRQPSQFLSLLRASRDDPEDFHTCGAPQPRHACENFSLAITCQLHAVSGTAEQVLVDLPYAGFAGTIALRPTAIWTIARTV